MQSTKAKHNQKEKKERLDLLLLKKGLCESREQAKRLIMAGLVYVDGEKEDKAGSEFSLDADIVLRDSGVQYVSRGGLKLDKALSSFSLDPTGLTCIDVGSSTGGFTDCLLRHGAGKVFCIDVGKGQLHWKLRNDPRVVPMEKTNIRFVKREDIGVLAELIVVDVAFISLKLVFPVIRELISENGKIVSLIKPQFEAGRELVGKKGVVKDPRVHERVLKEVFRSAFENGFYLYSMDFSPVKGPEGNIEFLACFSTSHVAAEAGLIRHILTESSEIRCLVERAHNALGVGNK